MAIGARAELPFFLTEEALNLEISERVELLKKKYSSVDSIQTNNAQKNIFKVIQNEIAQRLSESSIRWTFGSEYATLILDRDDDRIKDIHLADEIVETVATVTKAAIFITTSALEALYVKQASRTVAV